MPLSCAGNCGRLIVPVQADDNVGSRGPYYCTECFERKTRQGEVILPRERCHHIGCPVCGFVCQWPLDRAAEPVYCNHGTQPIWGYGVEPSEAWESMIPVKVVRS